MRHGALISVSVQDTTIPPILLNNTSVRETFSPTLDPGLAFELLPATRSVVLMNDPNPEPLMVTMSSSPANVGENDSMVGTASVKSATSVLCAAGSIHPGFGAPRVTTTGPLLALKPRPSHPSHANVDHGGSSTDCNLAGIELGIVVRSRTALRICAEMLAMNSHERTDRSTGRSDTGRFRNFDREGADGSLLSVEQHHRSAFRAQGCTPSHDRSTGRQEPLSRRSESCFRVFSDRSLDRTTRPWSPRAHGQARPARSNQLQRNGVADRVLHGRATGPVRQGV